MVLINFHLEKIKMKKNKNQDDCGCGKPLKINSPKKKIKKIK